MRRYLLIPAILLAVIGITALARPEPTAAGSNQAPVVTITSPSNGASFAQGATIQFTGTAIDPESGALGGVFMSWRSNIQPALGTGTSFTRNNLIVGTHVITLRATDPSGGPQGTATVTITVGVPTATPVPPTATHTATPVPPTATRTSTPVPPTATRTSTPVPPTATRTSTPVPPTATRTPILVPPTATRTVAVVPATSTVTKTAAPGKTTEATKTASPTKTLAPTKTTAPTRTKTPTRTPTATPTPRPPRPDRCADVDGSGRVTWRDVRGIYEAIRNGNHDPLYDINGNGRVGFGDLRIAIMQLGRRCHRSVPGATPTPQTTPPPVDEPEPSTTVAPDGTEPTAEATSDIIID